MKRILSLLLTLFIVIGVVTSAPIAVTATGSDTDSRFSELSFSEKQLSNTIKLTENATEYYAVDKSNAKAILSKYIDVEAFKKFLINERSKAWKSGYTVTSVDVSSWNIPFTNDVWNALGIYIANEPDLLGVDLSSCWYSTYIASITLSFLTKEEYEEEKEYLRLLTNETEKLLAGVKGNTTLSDLEKALIIHDRLAITCSYGYPEENRNYAYSSYGAIVLKKAVCSGYAFAYQYLLNEVGIKSEYCSSDALDHAWNIVYINNVPYHVDVTWDDRSEFGGVQHDNFMRSSKGFKETGHVATGGVIDYNTTPSSTTYDNYFWQTSTTGFQLLNNEIYYIDNSAKNLMKLNKTDGSDATVLKSLPDDWGWRDEFDYSSFACLATDGKYLYYSTMHNIYKYDPKTGASEVKYTLDLSPQYKPNEYAIWGLDYQDCTFRYEYYNYAQGDGWGIGENYIFTDSSHTQSQWITDSTPNCGNAGKRHIECTVCKTTIKTEILPANGKHIPGSWRITKKATTTSEGEKVRECTVCGVVVETAKVARLLNLATPQVKVANGAKGVKLTWSEIPNAKTYMVYRRNYNASTKKYTSWKVVKSNITDLTFVDESVKLGEYYSYAVRAVSGDEKSSYKATSAKAYNVTPVVKSANASAGVNVTWTTAANATGYTVYRSEYNAKTKKWTSWKSMGTAKSDKRSWVDRRAVSGVKYRYTVRAVYGKYRSSYKASATLLYLAQPKVTVANTSNGINVMWTQCSGATGYTVYRSELTDGKWSTWKNMGTAKSNKSSWTDRRSESGKTYRYTVRAVNSSTRSAYKASASVVR